MGILGAIALALVLYTCCKKKEVPPYVAQKNEADLELQNNSAVGQNTNEPVDDNNNKAVDDNNKGGDPGAPVAPVAEPAPGPIQPPTWEQLKAKVLAAIKKDEQPDHFEAILVEVTAFIKEAGRSGQLDTISVTLQEDAAVFFARRRVLSDAGSKQVLQKICNVCKNQ